MVLISCLQSTVLVELYVKDMKSIFNKPNNISKSSTLSFYNCRNEHIGIWQWHRESEMVYLKWYQNGRRYTPDSVPTR